MHEVSAYLGIGANLVPDGYDNLLEALEAAIAQIEEVTPIIQRSGWYRTAPVPVSDQPECEAGLSFIRLITPTTLGDRLPVVIKKAGGFVYYVAIAGITGTKSAATDSIRSAFTRLREETDLPAVAGFGIRSAEQASEVAAIADGVVVGSALVQKIEDAVSSGDDTKLIAEVGAFCASLAAAMQRK